ncbi:MAG: flagellar biosynthetic protein FliR [Phycisphaerae bacterium]|nr:flagellar biosynthetic protein FliR [Phycisphaerae bacterium]
MTDVTTNTAWVVTLAMVIARCGGIFAVAPVFAHAAVPVRLRLAMAVVVGLAAAGPLAGGAAGAPSNGWELGVALAMEAAIGALLGYLARLVFLGLELAAVHVGQQMGVGLAEVFHPLHEGTSQAVGGLLEMTGIVIFLGIGGHRMLVSALLGTFDVLPAGFARLAGPGVWPSCQAGLKGAVAMLATSFALALKVAAPVLAAILMATAAAGLVQKTLPQLNILTVGLPVQAMLGLAVLAASLVVLAPLLAEAVETLARQWAVAIQVAPSGP